MKIDNILGDNIGYVELIDSMGSDLTIVNNARVSFANQKEELDTKDEKLIAYLIKHKHWSPFRGVVFQFRAKVPLFICRQWWKHHIASSYVDSQNQWNEISMRYVDASEFEFYIPSEFRKQSTNNKQCSDGELDVTADLKAKSIYKHSCKDAIACYKELIEIGVGREQARGVLPTSIYTEFIWTCSLQALINFIKLRQGKGAQDEISLYADALLGLAKPIVPITIKELI